MKIPIREEKGFTLIELLIVATILGVLAAVVIPNVGRFIGQGEVEAVETELSNIQTAVTAMMVDNTLSTLPNPVDGIPIGSGGGGIATSNMSAFPDAISNVVRGTKVTDLEGYLYSDSTDKAGYVLYGHDITGSDVADPNPNQQDVNYVATPITKGTYIVDAGGTVTQVSTGYE